MSESKTTRWKGITIFSVLVIIAITVSATFTGHWVLTALPVGFLFGFFLEKADLCGASAFSEAFMWKDWRKLQGIWMIVAVSMPAFALFAGLDLIKLNPKPLLWANYIVGGAIFGVGMVLAGGCVSGSLYKSGQGNLNSMAALVGIPIGIMAVEHGPLNGFLETLKSYVVKSAEGGPVTFFSITHLPYWLLAIIITAVTLGVALYLRKKQNKPAKSEGPSEMPFLQRVLTRPWRPWQAGVAIGLLAVFAYMSSAASGRNYPLGVTHGVMHAELLVTDAPLNHVYAPQPKTPAATDDKAPPKPAKKVSWWLILEVSALVLGSFVSARLSGRAKLLPKPPEQTVTAFFGGILVGTGAAIARGCVVGNIMSGLALMSVGNLLFAVVVLLANWATTYIYLMGRQRV
ncbi:MAG: YeeE/YedE family protein [bacterium]